MFKITRDTAGKATGIVDIPAPTVTDNMKALLGMPSVTDIVGDSLFHDVGETALKVVVGGSYQNYKQTGRWVSGLFQSGSLIYR